MQSMVGTIQVDALLFFAIVEDDIETSGHGDEKLMALFERVAATIAPPGTS